MHCAPSVFRWQLLLSLVVVFGCNKDSDDPLSQYQKQNEWLQQNQARIRQAPAEPEPDVMAVTHYAAGQLYEKQGQIALAFQQYREAADKEPEFTAAFNRQGICLDKLGRYREADECFRQAIRLEPDQVHLHNNLAFSLILQKRWQEAEQALRRVLEMQPGYDRAQINLAIALAKQERYEDARVLFVEVVGEGMAQYNLGLIYKSQGKYPLADASFRRALALVPNLKQAGKQLQEVQSLQAATGRSFRRPATASVPPSSSVVPPTTNSGGVTISQVHSAPRAARRPSRAAGSPLAAAAPVTTQPLPASTPTPAVQQAKQVQVDPAAWEVLRRFAVPSSEVPKTASPQDSKIAAPQSSGGSGASIPKQTSSARPHHPTIQGRSVQPIGRPHRQTQPPAPRRAIVHQAPVISQAPLSAARQRPARPQTVRAQRAPQPSPPGPGAPAKDPCETEALEQDLALWLKQMSPCEGNEYVDQFVFGFSGGYEPRKGFRRYRADGLSNGPLGELSGDMMEALRPGATAKVPPNGGDRSGGQSPSSGFGKVLDKLQNSLQEGWKLYSRRLAETGHQAPPTGSAHQGTRPREKSATEAGQPDAGPRTAAWPAAAEGGKPTE